MGERKAMVDRMITQGLFTNKGIEAAKKVGAIWMVP